MAIAVDPRQLHRISPAEYRRLVEAAVFDEDARIEMIDGLLLDMGPKTREHENAISWLNHRITPHIDHNRYEVRIASPLTVGTSEPEPDMAIVERDTPRRYHPAGAALVIEVSAGSLVRDLQVKPQIYAAAGVPAYWVIDLDGCRAVAHTEPADHGYGTVIEIDRTGTLSAVGIELASLSVGELLAAAAR